MYLEGIQSFIEEIDADNVELTKADESAIFLAAIQDACSPEEFNLVMENAHELELYGLIESAEIATEAKKIVYKQTKQMNLNREQMKAVIRLARRANTASYKKYHKGRMMMLEGREEMVKQFGGKAKSEAKRVLTNAKKKSSSMKGSTVTGKTISDKMDKKIKEISE